jgi:hypothetical protein
VSEKTKNRKNKRKKVVEPDYSRVTQQFMCEPPKD